MIIVIFFLLIIPYAASLSFNISYFSANDHNIIYNLSASPAGGVIQLTRNQRDSDTNWTIGRASYTQPLQLWDKSSGNLTDFSSNFSFVINSLGRPRFSDGIAFFLAGSRTPPGNVTVVSSLGLLNDNITSNSTYNPFFAVEFDIYANVFDPPYTHVGIDIDSIISVATVEWLTNNSIQNGLEHEARIRYDSVSNNLTVDFTGYRNGSYIRQSLSYIVDFRLILPELVYIGFSGATGHYSALHNINSWNFSSTLEVVLTNSGISKTGLEIGFVFGGLVLLLGVGLSLWFFWRKRKRATKKVDGKSDVTLSDEFEQGNGPKKFFHNELVLATNNFSEDEKLGEGGFGSVYKGFLKDNNSYVAVKRVSRGSWQGLKEYVSEVKIISKLRHKNLVQLLGWCHEKQELLLVYEFMSNGSLDYHLFKGKSLLDWGTRFKIVQGLASALLYLHEEWEQCVVHRDIKSSNIMLDANFNAKLGDFGLARLVDHEKGSQTTVLAGTMGYMAPECSETGKATKKTDVFSFGVVVLEIACGRKPIDSKTELTQVGLVEWVWSLYGNGRINDAIDPKLATEFDCREMEQLMIVGLWCAHPDSNQRPSIRQAIRVLNFESPLPDLPSRKPVPTYCTPIFSPYSTIVSDSGDTLSDKTYSRDSKSPSSSTLLLSK